MAHLSQLVVSVKTNPTFVIATIRKTIDMTFKIDVALSKILFDLIVKIIDNTNAKPKTGMRYRFRPKSNPSI